MLFSVTDHCSHAVLRHVLSPALRWWDCGFISYSGHGCMSVFFLLLCCPSK